jgi:hypothetical protein
MRFALLCALLVLGACRDRDSGEDGVIAPYAPRQSSTGARPFERGHFVLTPRADFAVTARLLGKRRYGRGRMTPLSPWDFALGWGTMSDNALLRDLSLTQGDRFLFRHALRPGMPMETIDSLSANVHLVPADDTIAAQLARVPVGSLLSLQGRLVDVHDRRNGARYPTSLTRTDRGAGACEILFVEAVTIESDAAPAAAQ